jgi:hypothetical protein
MIQLVKSENGKLEVPAYLDLLLFSYFKFHTSQIIFEIFQLTKYTYNQLNNPFSRKTISLGFIKGYLQELYKKNPKDLNEISFDGKTLVLKVSLDSPFLVSI